MNLPSCSCEVCEQLRVTAPEASPTLLDEIGEVLAPLLAALTALVARLTGKAPRS